MSIQESINRKITKRIFARLKLTKYYDKLLIAYQFLLRELRLHFDFKKKKDIKVFFDYYSSYSHPFYKKRFYGHKAPLPWSNLKSSHVVHCLQGSSPKFIGKKVIIEPNDHLLVMGKSLGIYKPSELVRRSNEISDYISSPAVSKVLVGNNEIINHAKIYRFSDLALKKFFIYPECACTTKVSRLFLKEKNKNLFNRKIKFLSIASDFKVKAVDLLLEIFINNEISDELTLVCHNVPDYLKKIIQKKRNIFLIEDIPLTEKKKDLLYRNSDVYINLTHIDGGTVVFDAFEYGLPIITYTYHRGKGFLDNQNGILLLEPMKYYDPLGYGIKWDSMEEYMTQVDSLKKKNGYDEVQKELINAIRFYEKKPIEILNHGIRSLEYAEKNSLDKSNQILRNLYKEVSLES